MVFGGGTLALKDCLVGRDGGVEERSPRKSNPTNGLVFDTDIDRDGERFCLLVDGGRGASRCG